MTESLEKSYQDRVDAHFRQKLNDVDYAAYEKTKLLSLYWGDHKNCIQSMGSKTEGKWINTVTLYRKHTDVEKTRLDLLQIDENVAIDYTDCDLPDENAQMISFL
jgi:hypothetical protein